MDEIEFAQDVAKTLQKKTRETILRSMRLKGLFIDGFRNLEKVPIGVFINVLRKTKIKGKQCSTIFLKEVRGCNEDDPVIEVVRLWYGSEEDKVQAENKLQDLKMNTTSAKISNEMQDKSRELDQKLFQLENGLCDTKLEEQRNKNKQLQSKIQSLKIQLENAQKEIEIGNRENNHLNEENQRQKIAIKYLQQEISEIKEELQQVNETVGEYKKNIEFYQHIFKRAPRILCFTKSKVNEEDILLYNMTVCRNIESAMELDWNLFKKIWISENDFSLEQIQKIKEKATQKVNTARNIKSIIGRLR